MNDDKISLCDSTGGQHHLYALKNQIEFSIPSLSWANKIKISPTEDASFPSRKTAESFFSRKITWRNLYLILFNLWCVSYCCHFPSSSLTFDTISISPQTMTVIIIFTISYFSIFHVCFVVALFFQVGPIENQAFACYLKSQQTKCFSLRFSWNFTFFKIEKSLLAFQCRWMEINSSYSCFFLSCHRPLCHRKSNFVVPALEMKTNFLKDKTKIYCFW